MHPVGEGPDRDTAQGAFRLESPDSKLHVTSLDPLHAFGDVLYPVRADEEIPDGPVLDTSLVTT